MPLAEKTAECSWEGDLLHGSGIVTGGSGAFGELAVNWRSRAEGDQTETSPEELVAAAHASCFAMALSHGLSEAGNLAEQITVSAKVTLDRVDGNPTVTSSHLMVSGSVPGIDQAAFEQAAQDAGKNCPVSRALAGIEITVEARLED